MGAEESALPNHEYSSENSNDYNIDDIERYYNTRDLNHDNCLLINSLIQVRKFTEKSTNLDVKKKDTDEIYHLLVEYCASYLPDNISMRWNSKTVKNIVLSLSKDDILKKKIIKRAKQRLYLKKLQALSVLTESQQKLLIRLQHKEPFFQEIIIPYNYAMYLLSIDDMLVQLRLKLVPKSQINDDEFWYAYFGLMIKMIKHHIIDYANYTSPNMRTENIESKISSKNNNNDTNNIIKEIIKSPEEQLQEGWTCDKCQLRNSEHAIKCALCGKRKST